MKRQTYEITVSEEGWGVLGLPTVSYAMNSGITKSEGLVRDIARQRGVMYHGDRPTGGEGEYIRVWRAEGFGTVTATVKRVNA